MRESNTPTRVVTLQGLGPLSNPRVFRGYASFFIGAFLYGHVLLLVTGHWWFEVVAFLGMVSVFRSMRRYVVYAAPREASVDAVNLIGGWLLGMSGALLFFVIRDGPAWAMLVNVPVASVIAAVGLLFAVAIGEGRQWHRPWEPANVYHAPPARSMDGAFKRTQDHQTPGTSLPSEDSGRNTQSSRSGW